MLTGFEFKELVFKCIHPSSANDVYWKSDFIGCSRRQAIYRIASTFNLSVNVCLQKMDSDDFTEDRLCNISKVMAIGKPLEYAIEVSKFSNIDAIIDVLIYKELDK